MDQVDVVVVGAGPAGLGAALELTRRGFTVRVLERGGITESIRRYPRGMRFFTTRERVEIADVPFPIPDPKPTREQALAYYRNLALAAGLDLRPDTDVRGLDGAAGDFTVRAVLRTGEEAPVRARHVVLATGSFQDFVPLGCPGEDRDKVFHYYDEGHRYAACDVAVVGGANSAAEAALDLYRSGARVTLVHRGRDLDPGLKYWVGPDLRNRIAEGSIAARLGTRVARIAPRSLELIGPDGETSTLANDYVFALTGYRPAPGFLAALDVPHDPATLAPDHDPDTFESARPGVFVVGAMVAGSVSGRVFIENGRHHGRVVAEHLAARRARS